MTSANSSIEHSIIRISNSFDRSVAGARSRVGSKSRRPRVTECRSVIEREAEDTDTQRLDISFQGPNAPLIARPIHGLISLWVNATRQGDTDQYRKIKGTCSAEELRGVSECLAEFSRLITIPKNQKLVEHLLELGLKIECHTPSKVFFDFAIEGQKLDARVRSIITIKDGPLQKALQGKKGVKVEEYGPWHTSNRQEDGYNSGVKIIFDGQIGQRTIKSLPKLLARSPANVSESNPSPPEAAQ